MQVKMVGVKKERLPMGNSNMKSLQYVTIINTFLKIIIRTLYPRMLHLYYSHSYSINTTQTWILDRRQKNPR